MSRNPFKTTAAGFVCVKNRAVYHPVLKSLPYEHTVESWVRACFPDAVYQCSDATSISIPHAEADGVLAIQGAKGLGKSKFIAGLIAAMPETTTVLFITFQISLSHGSLHVLGPNAKLYSQQSGCLLPVLQPRLCVVINSLSRVEPGYDVVIVDELVSVVNAISSTQLVSPSLRTTILVHLHAILRQAKRVIVADAMLDASCLRFLLSCCLDANADADADALAPKRPVAAPKQLWVYDFTHRPHDDYVYVAHAAEDTWKEALRKTLEGGQNVVVACMTKTQAESLKAEYAPSFTTYCYTGDDSELLSKHMLEGVDEHWDKCQLLVYSPVITAGCSFERKHFDTTFFYGKCCLGSARTAIQMLSRVRDVSKKRTHVFLSQFGSQECALGYAPLPEDEEDAALHETRLCATPRTLKELHLDLLQQVNEFSEREQLISRTAFPYYFWLLAVNSGATITFEYEKSHGALLAAHAGRFQDAGVCEGSDGPSFVVRQEKPFAHAWDICAYKEYSCYSGKMLQRAGALHADRAAAMHLLAGVSVARETLSREPHGVGWWRGKDARCLAWVVLMAQRALVLASITGPVRKAVVSTQSDCQACIRPYVTTVFPIAADYASCQPPDLRIHVSLNTAFERYLNFEPATSCVDTTAAVHDAWLLAALDVSVRTTGTPVTETTLGAARPPELDGDCAKRISAIVAEAFDSFFLDEAVEERTEAWVGINVGMGSASGMAVADAVVVIRGVWNVLIFRASGSARCAYDFDVLKGLALMARAPKKGVLKLLYMEAGQMVTVNTSRWGSASALKSHLDSKKCMHAWNPSHNVVYMFLHAGGVDVLVFDERDDDEDEDGGRLKVHKTLQEAFEDPDSGIEDGRKVVTWGFREHFHSQFEKKVCDLEYALVLKLPTATIPVDVIPIESVSPELKDAVLETGVNRLCMLYNTVVKKCALVLFSSGCAPKCVDVYSVPSVAFLNQLHCIETHVL